MRARMFWFCAALVTLVVAGRDTAEATILVKKNLSQLAAESDCVVLAQATTENCAYAKGTQIIFTHTTFNVERCLKGKAGKSVVVSEVGGTIGNITTAVSGMPRFAEGERALIFLKKDALGQWRTHGCVQGRFPVVENLATGEQLVKLDPAMPHVHRSFFATSADPMPRAVTIEEFEAKLAQLVKKASEKEESK